MIDLDKDLEICNNATDGPWDFGYYNICSKEEAMELAGLNYEATKEKVGVRPHGFGAFVNGTDIKTADCGYSQGKSEDNARFTAHFNPKKVREMLSHIEELEETIKDLMEEYSIPASDYLKGLLK